MKLWKKISLLTAVVLFIAMGIFGGGMLYETWKYNLNQTVSSYQQQMKVNSYVIAQEINNNPLSRFSEVTRKSFLNYTCLLYTSFPDVLRDGDHHENGGDELGHREGQPDAGHAKEGGEEQCTEADGHKTTEHRGDEGPGSTFRGA